MNKIFFTSDLHLGHDRGFIYKPRGFSSIEEHDFKLAENWNSKINDDDYVYILGDLMLGDNKEGILKLEKLNGKFIILLGNHDTLTREKLYRQLNKVMEVSYATKIKFEGYHFYCSHYPTITANLNETDLKAMTLNLHGHTHSLEIFENDNPYMYNVALDAHSMCPVEITQVIKDIKDKYEECKKFL